MLKYILSSFSSTIAIFLIVSVVKPDLLFVKSSASVADVQPIVQTRGRTGMKIVNKGVSSRLGNGRCEIGLVVSPDENNLYSLPVAYDGTKKLEVVVSDEKEMTLLKMAYSKPQSVLNVPYVQNERWLFVSVVCDPSDRSKDQWVQLDLK